MAIESSTTSGVFDANTIFTGLNVIITAIAIVVACIAIWIQQRYQQKQLDRDSIVDIFGMLNETPHKSSEINIYDAYRNVTLMKDGKLNPDHENPASVVRRNYDQVGAMIANKLSPDTEFYQIFGVLTVVSYFILKDSIEQERKEHRYYMAHFTNLAISCFDFWYEQKEKFPITDPNGKLITREMLGEKIKLPKKRWLKF